jgi:serine protease inhibitor
MKQTWFLALVTLLCLLLALSGCSAAIRPADLMANVKAAEWPENPATPGVAYTNAVSAFGWQVFQASSSQPGNILVSPASIYLALAMALNGADGPTRTAIQKALASQDLTVDQINQACRDWSTLLGKSSDKTRLAIANSIWYRNGFTVDPKFLQTNADYFAAGAKSLDFNKPESLQTINSWVNDKTAGKISKIIDKIDPQVMMYLINAIYFKSDWKLPFAANKTVDRSFQPSSGEITAKFMHQAATLSYLEQAGRTGVILPYVDEQFAFFAILPATGESASAMATAMNPADFKALLASGQNYSVDLALPKFEVSYENGLKPILSSLGMDLAFLPDQADFSLMQPSRQKNLYITQVFHKTYCKVDEKGTEAAAVTSVEVGVTSMPSYDRTIVFDRPFIYGILDQATGVPLFIGILDNPKA